MSNTDLTKKPGVNSGVKSMFVRLVLFLDHMSMLTLRSNGYNLHIRLNQGSPNQAKWEKYLPYISWNHLPSKAKLKSPCFFLQIAPFLQIICILWCFMVKLMDWQSNSLLSMLNYIRMREKGFIKAIKKTITANF